MLLNLKKIKIEDIDVLFISKSTSKSIKIRVNEAKGVQVFVPFFVALPGAIQTLPRLIK